MKHCKLTANEIFQPLPESVTVCATVDEAGDEQVITELMIRRACEQMESKQVWPFVGEMVTRSLHNKPVNGAKIIPFDSRLN